MKIKEALLKSWNWLDGKKTTIGAIMQTGLIVTRFLKPNYFPESTYTDLQIVIGFWFGLSLGHKVKKAWNAETPPKGQ